MSKPVRTDFPEWMFERPIESVGNYSNQLRTIALRVQVVSNFLKRDPDVVKLLVDKGAEKPLTIGDLADELDKAFEELDDTVNELLDFRNAVRKRLSTDDLPSK